MLLCVTEFVGLILNLAWVMFALEISNKWAEAERKSIFSEIGLRREPSVQGFV